MVCTVKAHDLLGKKQIKATSDAAWLDAFMHVEMSHIQRI